MKKISNYHELVVEKQRLHQKLSLLKRDVDNEIAEIKQQWKPVTRIIGMVTGHGESHNGQQHESLLKSGLKAGGALAVDLLVGRKLAKAGMIAKLVVPPLLKGLGSKLLSRFRRK